MPKVKAFPVKFRPEENLRLYKDAFQEDFETCEKINSAKVCDDRHTFKMLYCQRRLGKAESCNVLGEGEYLSNMAAYLAWYHAEPQAKGYGKRFYHELEDWLAKKRCIKTINLHALASAEDFWERMGFQDVDDEEYEDWWEHYKDLRKLSKPLPKPRSCTPEKAVGEYIGPTKEPVTLTGNKLQKTLDYYKKRR